jgi:hypothetical protein
MFNESYFLPRRVPRRRPTFSRYYVFFISSCFLVVDILLHVEVAFREQHFSDTSSSLRK